MGYTYGGRGGNPGSACMLMAATMEINENGRKQINCEKCTKIFTFNDLDNGFGPSRLTCLFYLF